MNKKGFTLIELLAVIVLLAIIILIAVPTIGGVTNSVKKKMLDSKVELIEEAAILYGQDFYKGSLPTTEGVYQESDDKYYNCKSVSVKDLVESEYLKNDNDHECQSDFDEENAEGCVINPTDDTLYLDNKEVIIFYKNKRVKAVVDMDNSKECNIYR